MKKIIHSMMFIVLTLAACSPQITTAIPSPIPSLVPNQIPSQAPSPVPSLIPPIDPTATHIPVDIPQAQRVAIAALSQTLNVSPEQIAVVSSEAVTWPDGCLGVQPMGVFCTQSLVPGFRIVLSAKGKQYEYHTNQDGSVIVLASKM